MDLLIHAIIWLFRNLFGSQEPQAHLGSGEDDDSIGLPREPRSSRTFGKDSSSGGGDRPKTLAELLEEARQQMNQAQTRGPAAPPLPPQPQTQPVRRQVIVPPEPPSTTQPVQVLPRPVHLPSHAPAVAPPLPAETRAMRKAEKAAKRRREQQAAQPQTQADQAKASAAAFATLIAKPVSAQPPTELLVWLQSLHSSRPDLQRTTAIHAMASLEILGPPRCKRPFGKRP